MKTQKKNVKMLAKLFGLVEKPLIKQYRMWQCGHQLI